MKQSLTKPENEQIIEQMFDSISGRYDFLNRLLSLRQDQRWRRHLVERIPKSIQNGTYLDIATGTGDVLIQASKQCSFGRWVGVDISNSMLALAREKAKNLPIKSEFQKMSAEKLDFIENSISCISISFGFRNVVNKLNAIDEWKRVLKLGGMVFVLEFFNQKEGLFAKLFQYYFSNILPKIGALFSSAQAYNYLPKSVETFMSSKEFINIMNTKGFILEDRKSYLFGNCQLLCFKKS